MRTPHRYLLSLAATYAVTTFLLAFYSATSLDLYASVFIVEYFILTLLHTPLSAKTQKFTNLIGYVLFAVFLLIAGIKIMEILGANVL
ncbi:MAG: hypothetical protein NWE93_05990 [Candidatus Bathyarchaeota archaeon]|nr:hypothetical protein [Candidatus Bathyarchaeota archaeon]